MYCWDADRVTQVDGQVRRRGVAIRQPITPEEAAVVTAFLCSPVA
jgi:hypothetical protein